MNLRAPSSAKTGPARAAFGARTWALGLALACLTLQVPAKAEPPSNAALVAHYSADGDCPDRTEFERRLRARLSAASRVRSMRFDVRLERSTGGAHGTLQVVGQSGARELSAASCAEAADALALVAALMLNDPGAQVPASEPAQLEARPTRRPEPRGGGRASSAGSSEQVPAESSIRSEAPDQVATAKAELDSEQASAPSAPAETARARSTPDPIPTPPREAFLSDWHLRAWAGGLLAWGVAPQLRAGPNVMVAVSARAHGRGPRYALGLGARGVSGHQIRIPEGKAKLRWIALATSLCLEGPERRFSVSGCALLETGWLEGSSKDGVRPRERSRFWGALGPALALNALLHPRFGLRLGGELLGVFMRDRFFLAERLLYSVPRLAFRAELSLYFSVW